MNIPVKKIVSPIENLHPDAKAAIRALLKEVVSPGRHYRRWCNKREWKRRLLGDSHN